MDNSGATPSTQSPLDWTNIALLTLVHVAAFGGMALYLPVHGLSLAATLIGVVLTGLTIFSISAGYHRLFSHKTYEAHPAFRVFLLAFGAGAFQNTVLAWVGDHRRHHGHTDSDQDPYDARRGFWHSHIGWVVRKSSQPFDPKLVSDLLRDPLIMWQQRHYGLIGITTGLVLPTILGWAFGDPLGGFVVGAAVRLLVCYHVTFAINSFAHWLGSQPYSDRSSARDSALVALLSMGEGYHNFHHAFPSDYRNGVRTHHFDPTKWVLFALSKAGLVRQLHRTPAAAVLRARLRMDERRLQAAAVAAPHREQLQQLRARINSALNRFQDVAARWEAARRDSEARPLWSELQAARRELRGVLQAWRRALRLIASDAVATPAR